jgi:hypothetical protein
MIFEETLVHHNGLVLRRPAGFGATMNNKGFYLTEKGDLRSTRNIAVSLVDANPLGDEAQKRMINGKSIRYRVSEIGAGSGGVERELVAVKQDQELFVVVTAIEQTEYSEPFIAAWSVIEHIQLRRKSSPNHSQ